ncbi:hypothetical protein F5X99DRAFT_337791 [Biscogniauxia marginata]|nr:hypothetical protein F5X99DRAFT_337791 [Biscogniauxia marginata]
MTEPVFGSSLPQARDQQHNHYRFHTGSSRHSHHDHKRHQHQHHHHARSPSRKNTHKRNISEPTTIVETISVLELIDATGGVITVETLPTSSQPAPTTTANTESQPASTTDPDAGKVTALEAPSSAPGTSTDDGGDTSLSSLVPTIDPTVAPSGTSMLTSFPTLSYSPVTSTPLSPAPAFPSLPGISNTTFQSTSSSISSNSTTSTTTSSSQSFTSSGASSFSDFLLSSIGVSSVGSTSTTSFTSLTSISTSSLSSATSTTTGGDGSSGTGEDDGSAVPTNTSAAGDDSDSSDGPSVATVAGSVLGAVAGLAFILVIALVALRWKKRRNALKQGGSTGEQGTRALPGGNSGPPGGGEMSEQKRSGPFAVPAALASLSGYKRFSKSTVSSDGGERGFAKVSGRKLPPVIQFGGDGYSDPRATIMSDQSIEYRDSQNILGNPSSSRLAVGTPMRPDSGVPVFHAGPARTPVTEPNPFSSYEDNSPLEPPGRDPLGRSHPSHDGSTQSRGSGSRFTENL